MQVAPCEREPVQTLRLGRVVDAEPAQKIEDRAPRHAGAAAQVQRLEPREGWGGSGPGEAPITANPGAPTRAVPPVWTSSPVNAMGALLRARAGWAPRGAAPGGRARR